MKAAGATTSRWEHMKKVLTFGEILLRSAPDDPGNWLRQNAMPVYVGGAEANVAAALSLWGIPVSYCTAVPENVYARQILTYLNDLGIDTSPVIFKGGRMGTYILNSGSDLKHAGVIYDRSGSAFSSLEPSDLNWDALFEDVCWFHFSAINPAINRLLADISLEAAWQARSRNIPVSIDLNYRSKLWQYGKMPSEVMPAIVDQADYLMGNIWAADTMLNVPLYQELIASSRRESYLHHAGLTSTLLKKRYPRLKWIANTFRFAERRGLKYYTTLFTEGQLVTSPVYFAEKVPEQVGSGDCFMAGLIYGSIKNQDGQSILDSATSAAFSKLFVVGDMTTTSISNSEKFARKYRLETTDIK